MKVDIEGKAGNKGEDKAEDFERVSRDTNGEENIKAKMIADGRLREEGSKAKMIAMSQDDSEAFEDKDD